MTINWDAVFDHLVASRLPEWDKEALASAVPKAVEKWAADDFKQEIVEVEAYSETPFRHKRDILLRDPQTNQLTLIDWKTKKTGLLDDRWVLKQVRSPQRKIYAAGLAEAFGSDIFPIKFEIRALTLGDEPVKTKVLPSVIWSDEANEARRHLKEESMLRDTLIQIAEVPWPKNPSGCQMYGPAYKCEFEDICWNRGAFIPPTNLEKVSKTMSHSAAQEWLRCKERFRLLNSIPRVELAEDEDDLSSSAAGSVFHEMVEMIWRELKLQQQF